MRTSSDCSTRQSTQCCSRYERKRRHARRVAKAGQSRPHAAGLARRQLRVSHRRRLGRRCHDVPECPAFRSAWVRGAGAAGPSGAPLSVRERSRGRSRKRRGFRHLQGELPHPPTGPVIVVSESLASAILEGARSTWRRLRTAVNTCRVLSARRRRFPQVLQDHEGGLRRETHRTAIGGDTGEIDKLLVGASSRTRRRCSPSSAGSARG